MTTGSQSCADRAKQIADKYIGRDGREPQVDEPEFDNAAECARLAQLPIDEYDRERQAVADKLGIRVGTLDKIVKQSRKGGADGQGKAIVVVDVDPWPDPIDGAQLLDEIAQALLDHIVLTPEQADTAALWCTYTHGYEVWRIAPRLGIRAPSKACGKTEALRRVKRLVARPISCENLTTAVLFRLIDGSKPTLLLDETDNLLPEDKGAMLGALNSGYERSGRVFRCVGDQNELRSFSTFSPMAYAMIGTPPGTFDSRTIAIQMRRATPSEARKLLSMEDGEAEDNRFQELGRKAARWTNDNLCWLAELRCDMDGLVNRTADNWRPLFTIADVVGGTWPERARKAARALSAALESNSAFEETLAAIDDMIRERDEITSKEIVERLVQMEGGPWAEWGKDRKPITQNALARLLKPHKVFPCDIGPERMRRKGYKRSQFDHLFEAYLNLSPPPRPDNRAAAQNAMESPQLSDSKPRSSTSGCADGKGEKSSDAEHLRGCADAAGAREQEDDIPAFRRGDS